MEKVKSFIISKRQVWEAYKCVKANRGGAGIDNQSIVDFEKDITNNLFKIWNRMSSGSYFPPPVARIEIPKGDGRMRPLGIPTVRDRVAQMVVKQYLEPLLEPHFHRATCKYKKLRGRQQKATRWLTQIAERQPNLFVHWRILEKKRLNDRSRMSREIHVRF
nr:hypothetical protein [uncultured Desulfobacter sp.]